MYEIFDSFCRRATWDTSHPSDLKIFRDTMGKAVKLPGFSPEQMSDYIRHNHADPIWPKSNSELDAVIQRLVKDAQTALRRRAS